MEKSIDEKLREAVWIAHSLFERGKTSGSTANLSFKHEGKIYISRSGSCFGTLTEDDFAIVDYSGSSLNGKKPSKEYTMHKYYYEHRPDYNAVIHTHGPYAVLCSCRKFDSPEDIIPAYTPYLGMKVGRVGLIPYGPPGSEELFEAFKENLPTGDAYILKNHGGVVGGKSLMDAFYGIEELEESAKIACLIETQAEYELIK